MVSRASARARTGRAPAWLWLALAAGLVHRHHRHAGVAVDIQPVALDHVLAAREHHVADQHHLARRPGRRCRVLPSAVSPGWVITTLPSASSRRTVCCAAAGLPLLARWCRTPGAGRCARSGLALDGVDIAGEGGDLLVLLEHQLVRGDLDRLVATGAAGAPARLARACWRHAGQQGTDQQARPGQRCSRDRRGQPDALMRSPP